MTQTYNAAKNYKTSVGPLGLITSGNRVRKARRRRSLQRVTLILVFAMGFLLIGRMALAGRNGATKPAYPRQVVVTVQAGDTLWKLAHRYGDPHKYILERVDDLASENNLSAEAVLLPGQRITIPIHNAEDFARVTAQSQS